jgi:transposase
MNSIVSQVGIDVGKATLFVSIDEKTPFEIANEKKACLALAGRLPAKAEVHLEASGGYDRTVRRALEEAGFEVRVHNPYKARCMARARSSGAKTDKIDAKHLSQTGQLLPVKAAKSEEREGLADQSRALESLRASASSYRLKLAQPELDPEAKAVYAGVVEDFEARIEKLEKAIEQRLKNSSMASDYALLLTVPGVGKAIARVCLAELPEDLRERTPAEIASYAGLAPLDNSSGTYTGKSRIGTGNVHLKAVLYMGALSLCRNQAWARDHYDRLRAKGKHHLTAIIAIMRRLLMRIVAVLKRGTPWQEVVPRPQNT